MFADLAFFSFVELTDPTQHRAYNEWHQLDHRPENLALPGVAWGDRWARPDGYREQSTTAAEFAGVDYLAMYWFRQPLAASLDAWDKLGEDSFQWGRGPIIPGVERRMLAFFRPVKGYAAPRIGVSADVLPFRPNRGLHVTLTRFAEPHSAETHTSHGFEDRELIPSLLALDGVAGAWTFAFSHSQQHATLPLHGGATDAQGGLRMRLLYLDGDPLEAADSIRTATPDSSGEVLFSSPLKTIIPWQDW
jgi:hypothetical protein